MGIDPGDLRRFVIRPVTISLGLGGDAAEELLLGTALQESGGRSLVQRGGGPAIGLWQMEPKTHDDLWEKFIQFRPVISRPLLMWVFTELPKAVQMVGNLYYACGMARIQYFRSRRPLPEAGDLQGQAEFYKAVYNTPAGDATVDQYIANAKGVLV